MPKGDPAGYLPNIKRKRGDMAAKRFSTLAKGAKDELKRKGMKPYAGRKAK